MGGPTRRSHRKWEGLSTCFGTGTPEPRCHTIPGLMNGDKVWMITHTRTLKDHHQYADPSPVNELPTEQPCPRLEFDRNLPWFGLQIVVIFAELNTDTTRRQSLRSPNESGLDLHLEHLDLKKAHAKSRPTDQKCVWAGRTTGRKKRCEKKQRNVGLPEKPKRQHGGRDRHRRAETWKHRDRERGTR